MSSLQFQIRGALFSELPAISVIEDDSFPAPYSLSLLERLLRDCHESFFVAVDQADKVLGYCVCTLGKNSAHLISIAVDHRFRRKGIATLLLRRSIEYFTAKSVHEFYLEVETGNVEAVALYRKLGFEKVGVLKKYYSNGSDGLGMRMILEPALNSRYERASGTS